MAATVVRASGSCVRRVKSSGRRPHSVAMSSVPAASAAIIRSGTTGRRRAERRSVCATMPRRASVWAGGASTMTDARDADSSGSAAAHRRPPTGGAVVEDDRRIRTRSYPAARGGVRRSRPAVPTTTSHCAVSVVLRTSARVSGSACESSEHIRSSRPRGGCRRQHQRARRRGDADVEGARRHRVLLPLASGTPAGASVRRVARAASSVALGAPYSRIGATFVPSASHGIRCGLHRSGPAPDKLPGSLQDLPISPLSYA